MPQNFDGADFPGLTKQLEASFTLAGYLLEAQDEAAAILAAMQTGNDMLGANGCAFVPFNEWAQSAPVLRYGESALFKNPEWQARLSDPETRHTCRVCAEGQAGSNCVLLRNQSADQNVFCVSLRCGGREIGVISYFFSAPPQVNDNQHRFLAEMVRLTDLALDAIRGHAQQVDAAKRASLPVGDELIAMNSESKKLLEQLEYKAVLNERMRLAREIHDGLAQTLAFLKIEAARMQSYISKGEVDTVTNTLQACYRTLSDAYLDARQAIDNLRRVPDEALGDWLYMAAQDFSELTDMSVDLSNVHLKNDFTPGVKLQLMRILQEALTNIRKHAGSCAVAISAFEGEGEAVLEVHDNGRGFSPEERQPMSQYGLRSMRERAESIGADFQIVSAPGAGTTMKLRIPIMQKANS